MLISLLKQLYIIETYFIFHKIFGTKLFPTFLILLMQKGHRTIEMKTKMVEMKLQIQQATELWLYAA